MACQLQYFHYCVRLTFMINIIGYIIECLKFTKQLQVDYFKFRTSMANRDSNLTKYKPLPFVSLIKTA